MTLSHLDKAGKASMVDVSGKDVTERIASARVTVKLNSEAFEALSENKIKKGDVLAVANIAGINAAKKTSELIPLTHQINLRHVKIEFVLDKESSKIEITTEVKANDKTGVEMEALTAASVSALTIYDMCKSIDPTVEISNLRLIFK